jgi:hypothetical protein
MDAGLHETDPYRMIARFSQLDVHHLSNLSWHSNGEMCLGREKIRFTGSHRDVSLPQAEVPPGDAPTEMPA